MCWKFFPYHDQPEPTDKDNSSMLPSFDHAPSKRRQEKAVI